jgi:hypothetical protein
MVENEQLFSSKEEVCCLLVSEAIRNTRVEILGFLDARKVIATIGHAAILSLADDIRREHKKGDDDRVEEIVTMYHGHVLQARLKAAGEGN